MCTANEVLVLAALMAVGTSCKAGSAAQGATQAVDSSAPPFGAFFDAGSGYDGGSVGSAQEPPWSIESGAPGWTSANVGPCAFALPVDPLSAIPALSWMGCSNGAAHCEQLVQTWPSNNPPYSFGYAKVSHDATGRPALLKFTHALSGVLFEDDVYDLRSGAQLGGVRTDASSACIVEAIAGTNNASLVAFPKPGQLFWGAQGPAAATLAHPVFVSLVGSSTLVGAQTVLASDALVAFDSPLAGAVVRWALGSSTVVISKTPHVPLLLDFVEQDDVYAFSESGTAGWQQEYLVGADGTVTLYRAEPMAHVVAFATDGTTIFWSEASGAPPSSNNQPNVTVWSAPYTGDPTKLAATAAPLAKLPVAFSPGSGIAFQSLYALAPGPRFDVAYVVNLTDGSVKSVSAGPPWQFNTLLLVSPTELWAIVNVLNGPSGVELVRYTL